jgi:hypothetical protein
MTDVVTDETVPRRRRTAKIRRLRGTLVVSGPVDAYELTDAAALIFQSADGVRTIGEIGKLVADEYDVPLAEAVADANELITDLIDCQVMEIAQRQVR